MAINRAAGRAMHKYEMIEDGDRIAVGLSGGKDSITLFHVLTERLRRLPVKYELYPLYIDPGFEGSFSKELAEYCESVGYKLTYEITDHGRVAHSSGNGENPCFLCSRLRRKRLFEVADQLGCNKLALGHNKDDIIETLFLNMCYSGNISTMSPMQEMFDGRFKVIRPLAFVNEDSIKRFVDETNLPEFLNNCPSAGKTKRQEIKSFLNQLYQNNPNIKGNIFKAMSHVRLDYMLK